MSLCREISLLARHLHKTFNTLGVSHPVTHYSYIRARLVWRRRKNDKTTEGCLQHWPFLKRSRRDVSSLDCQCYGGWRLDCRPVVTLPLGWWDIILQPTPCWRWSVDASVHDFLHERDLVALTWKPERTTSYHYLCARVAIGNDYVGWSSLMSVSTPPVLWDRHRQVRGGECALLGWEGGSLTSYSAVTFIALSRKRPSNCTVM